jgi:hypothetical protein
LKKMENSRKKNKKNNNFSKILKINNLAYYHTT